MIAGRVIVDLARVEESASEEARHDRRQLAVLEHCPDGAEVIIRIGRRQYVTQDAAHWLHEHDERLSITIEGDLPDAVLNFVRAARAGDWSAVA